MDIDEILGLLAALFLSAIVSAIAIGFAFSTAQIMTIGRPLDQWLGGIFIISLFASLLTLPSAFLLGPPIFLLLRAMRLLTPLSLSLAGGTAAMTAVVILAAIDPDPFSPESLFFACLLFPCGCVAGWSFWRLNAIWDVHERLRKSKGQEAS